jgi:hypothetical protein
MQEFSWSGSEKKIARRAFDKALAAALAATMAEFRARAAAATTPDDMWAVEAFLRRRHRAIDDTFDYRYSRLPEVFVRLICDGHIDMASLDGLADDKLEIVRRSVSFIER